MPVSILNASPVSTHLDPDHTVVAEWLKGIWRQNLCSQKMEMDPCVYPAQVRCTVS